VGAESIAVQSVPTTIRATRAAEAPAGALNVPARLRLPVLMGIERAYE
jgi:hypothetical protein